jgi:hypothetical protein
MARMRGWFAGGGSGSTGRLDDEERRLHRGGSAGPQLGHRASKERRAAAAAPGLLKFDSTFANGAYHLGVMPVPGVRRHHGVPVVARPPLWMRLLLPQRAGRRQRELIAEHIRVTPPPSFARRAAAGTFRLGGPHRRPGRPPAGVREPRRPKPPFDSGSGSAANRP